MIEEAPDVSVVIPVFNEVQSLESLLAALRDAFSELDVNYELLFVDDGSTDGSTEYLKRAAESTANVKLIEFRRNFGKSAALAAGFKVARGEAIITMDADLQDDPREIHRMLETLKQGYDLVTGWKAERQDPPTKTIPSFIANTTTRLLTGVNVRDMNSGFKCYRRRLAKEIHLYGDLHRYVPVLAHFRGYRITEIPVKHHPRQYGQSKYGFSRFLRGMMDLLTVIFISYYRYRPLHLFGGLGLLLSGAGVIIGLYMTVLRLQGEAIGNRPLLLLAVLLIVVGVQFISFGLLGELLVYENSLEQDPLEFVREIHE